MGHEQGSLFPPEPTLDSRISSYWMQKPNGTKRQVWHTESNEILWAHRRYLSLLRSRWQPLPCVTGGEPGSSPLRHVRAHRGNGNFFVVDMKNAYSQVDHANLRAELARLDICDDEFLDRFALHPSGKGLLLGMPASPSLFNLACHQLDQDLLEFCAANGMRVTRYLDDVICSSSLERPFTRVNRRDLLDLFTKHKWHLNGRKTKLLSHTRGPVILSGIQLDPNGGLRPSKRLTRQARLVIQAASLGEESYARAAGYNGALVAASDVHVAREVRSAQDIFYNLDH